MMMMMMMMMIMITSDSIMVSKSTHPELRYTLRRSGTCFIVFLAFFKW
jgi:hypothetical protein